MKNILDLNDMENYVDYVKKWKMKENGRPFIIHAELLRSLQESGLYTMHYSDHLYHIF